jgi:hypothetical protein
MPILETDLRRNFRLFEGNSSLQDVLAETGDDEDIFLVIRTGDRKFIAVHRSEVIRAFSGLPRLQERVALLNAPLADLLESFAAEAVDQATTELWQAEQVRKKLPGQALVVLANDQVVGLLAPRAKEAVVFRSGSSAAGTREEETLAAVGPTKKINVQMADSQNKPVRPAETPLQLSHTYSLIIDISDEGKPASLVADAFFKYRWQEHVDAVEVTIRLESDEFQILTGPQEITITRQGESTSARFDVKPDREGPGFIKVLFFKDDVFIQLLILKFTIVDGALFSEDLAGRPLEAAFTLGPRSVNLVILESNGGYQLIMTGAVAATARLPITPQALAYHISNFHKTMQGQIGLMKSPDAPEAVYLRSIDIPLSVRDQTLKKLAETGYGLYREIFYGFDADVQANLMGDKLRLLARGGQTLKIQVFSQHFTVPWGLLYLAGEDEYDLDEIHPEWFLGMQHIVEQIPLQQTMLVMDHRIDSRANLKVSINVNVDIDKKMGAPLVGSQLEYWRGVEKKGGTTLVQRTTLDELVGALKTTQSTDDQIIYFYCHASSKDLEQGGPDASTLVLGGSNKLTLKELKQSAPHTKFLPGEPLIFINACESAELSPLIYDGFVPYFLAKGARGVIGTVCEIPALFAAEWARRFFDRFLRGKPLGGITLELRREFFNQHQNILGLLYALYVDGDTQIVPGLKSLEASS